MLKILGTIALILVTSSQSSFLKATEFVNLKLSGSELLYPLPSGYCDVTKDPDGIVLKRFLDNTKMIVKSHTIVKLCNRGIEHTGYPWAWIGIMKNEPKWSQKDLNKYLAKLLKDEDKLEKLYNYAIEDNRQNMKESFGLETTLTITKQKILWADEKSIISGQILKTIIEGDLIEEVLLTSAYVVKDLIVYTYFYNLKDALPSTAELTKLLIENASKINDLNF